MMSKLKIISTVLFLFCFFFLPSLVSAQQISPVPAKPEFIKGQVITIQSEKPNPYSNYKSTIETVTVTILDGTEAGKTIQIDYNSQNINDLKLNVGDTVIVSQLTNPSGKITYSIEDKYRLPSMSFIIVLFVLLVILITGWKGIKSFIGLGLSLLIIFSYIIPQILAGQDPLTTCLSGAFIILFLTTYAAHGFSKQTTIALFSTFLALLLTFFLSILIGKLSLISGYADENAIAIHFGTQHLIDVKGLLLGGIILGTLGALNDVTITQAATVFEIFKTDKNMNRIQLFKKSLVIGREHLTSLINTLVLAYAGSSLIVFIFLFYNSSYYPLWVILNSETLNEEILRTVAGTTGLVLVVPIVTFIASYFATKNSKGV